MGRFTNKFHENDLTFDFVYLFISLTICSCAFLIFVNFIDGKPLFDNDDLKFLQIKRLFIFALIIPLVEEFGIRGIFSLKNKFCILLFGIALIILLITFISNDIIKIIATSIVLIFCTFIFFKSDYRKAVNNFIGNNYIYFLIISSLIFGGLHVFNYEKINYLTILKIIPKILGGFYLGYIAYKYSIWHSYLMHALNNFIPFIIMLVYYYYF